MQAREFPKIWKRFLQSNSIQRRYSPEEGFISNIDNIRYWLMLSKWGALFLDPAQKEQCKKDKFTNILALCLEDEEFAGNDKEIFRDILQKKLLATLNQCARAISPAVALGTFQNFCADCYNFSINEFHIPFSVLEIAQNALNHHVSHQANVENNPGFVRWARSWDSAAREKEYKEQRKNFFGNKQVQAHLKDVLKIITVGGIVALLTGHYLLPEAISYPWLWASMAGVFSSVMYATQRDLRIKISASQQVIKISKKIGKFIQLNVSHDSEMLLELTEVTEVASQPSQRLTGHSYKTIKPNLPNEDVKKETKVAPSVVASDQRVTNVPFQCQYNNVTYHIHVDEKPIPANILEDARARAERGEIVYSRKDKKFKIRGDRSHGFYGIFESKRTISDDGKYVNLYFNEFKPERHKR